MVNIETKLMNEYARPVRAHATDAGADLKSMEEDFKLCVGCSKMIDTGVAVKIPKGFVGLVFSRSGQGKYGVTLANSVGVIDSDYRGNIKVILKNSGQQDYEIKLYDKVAQLVIIPIVLAQYVEYSGEWDDTERSVKGFGSTDTK